MKKNIAKKNTVAKSKTVANNIDKTLTARQLTAQKNGKVLGRPPGVNSTGLVTLETLIKSLPATAQIPVGIRFLRIANIAPEATFVSNSANLKNIAESYKAQTNVVVKDLNSETEEVTNETAQVAA